MSRQSLQHSVSKPGSSWTLLLDARLAPVTYAAGEDRCEPCFLDVGEWDLIIVERNRFQPTLENVVCGRPTGYHPR